ncbi:MAG: methyltransferase domain-containing protein [Ktedonobacteraceae bacterium]|nr:methyltransferase domain-containing protein [Ktedonobacteraceae bacterium]
MLSSKNDRAEQFNERYILGETPWDTGISPPELLEVLEHYPAERTRRMLDIGCGTGTNSLTAARQGWQVVGIDFAQVAIDIATRKAQAQAEEITRAGGSVRFLVADITRLTPPPAEERFSLLLDLGCLNGIPADQHAEYMKVVAEQALPGALFLLYAHLPIPDKEHPRGITPEELDRLVASTFRLIRREMGEAPQGGQSMWNWLERIPSEES